MRVTKVATLCLVRSGETGIEVVTGEAVVEIPEEPVAWAAAKLSGTDR